MDMGHNNILYFKNNLGFSMELSDFDYYLPQRLIAQHPSRKRDESRLMVYNRATTSLEHRRFKDIIDYLNPGDCMVINDTRVIPARLIGVRKDTSGAMEFLLLSRIEGDRWITMVKPGKRAKVGATFVFGEGKLTARVLKVADNGCREVEFQYNGIFQQVLEEVGQVPLPPYITQQLSDNERYQTVYSREYGSAAAPTAGLHFTHNLLRQIEEKGVKLVNITLHVGLGTFRPVKTQRIEEHSMHSEYFVIDGYSARIINDTRQSGGRIIAVGTTSVRTLESAADDRGWVRNTAGWTDIFIYPGYSFKVVDCLVTNFHLPKSTLLMLVSAFAGREKVLDLYRQAIALEYRFFSFGDAMLIL
jgi:S-adenosylmethionine:tRNA ribosyltransferase-isomerase